jgi:hypothetical protein
MRRHRGLGQPQRNDSIGHGRYKENPTKAYRNDQLAGDLDANLQSPPPWPSPWATRTAKDGNQQARPTPRERPTNDGFEVCSAVTGHARRMAA